MSYQVPPFGKPRHIATYMFRRYVLFGNLFLPKCDHVTMASWQPEI